MPPNACVGSVAADNPIDAAICARTGPTRRTPASEGELCRRLFLDLTGAIPTPEERASTCAGKPPGEIADALFKTERYVEMQRRYWIQEKLKENYMHTHGTVLNDGDVLLDQLARGELGYDDFAANVIAHPVVTANQAFFSFDAVGNIYYHPDEVADRMIHAFLGRAPLGDEVIDFASLFRVWEPRVYSLRTPRPNSYFPMVGRLNSSACAGLLGECTSVDFGATVTVDLSPYKQELANFENPPGDPDFKNPPGYVDYARFGGHVPADVQAELEKPGRLLASQDEFWDEAADDALRRLLGWWKSTKIQPDSDFPEVRYALSSWFRATKAHDVRALYRVVLTSLLYTTSAELDPAEHENAALSDLGPTKPMSTEMWLDSAARATGLVLGFCDPHTDEAPMPDVNINSRGPYYNNYLRKPQPADLWIDPTTGKPFDYYAHAKDMSGCRGGNPRAIHPGLKTLFAQLDLVPTLCHGANALGRLVPADVDPDDTSPAGIRAIMEHLFQRMLQRDPAPEEIDAITREAACAADNTCGMPVAEAVCGAILRSSAFIYY